MTMGSAAADLRRLPDDVANGLQPKGQGKSVKVVNKEARCKSGKATHAAVAPHPSPYMLTAMGNTFCEVCSASGWRIYHTPEKPCTKQSPAAEQSNSPKFNKGE